MHIMKQCSQFSNTIGMFEDLGTFSTTKSSPTPEPLKIAAIDSLSPFQTKNRSIQNNLSIWSVTFSTHTLHFLQIIRNFTFAEFFRFTGRYHLDHAAKTFILSSILFLCIVSIKYTFTVVITKLSFFSFVLASSLNFPLSAKFWVPYFYAHN